MRILFIWNYHYFPREKGKSRFSDLLEAICQCGHEVEVVCSAFYHMGKTFRDIEDPYFSSLPYRVHFINEKGYKRNISLRRFSSIQAFNKGVADYLSNHEPVDIVYVPVPSNELGSIAESFAKRVGAKCIIDVEDLWPESFRMVVPTKPLYKLFFGRAEKRRANLFANADAIVGVSQTYVDLARQSIQSNVPTVVAPIGSDVGYVHKLRESFSSRKPKDEFWIAYIGTLSKSYDLNTPIEALDALSKASQNQFVLKVMGSGPDAEKIKKFASKRNARVDFLGLLPYEEMCNVLFDCDIALNPIIGSSVSSLINKVADYAAVGLPVINTQQSKEYQELLERYSSGINCDPQNTISMQRAIMYAYRHPKWLAKARLGAEKMAIEVFDRDKSQRDILSLIDHLGGQR